ncbi:unnamed protein product [Chondrus crispus]|uniref:Amino acid transporter transmembrane domain-containing protein n=1 Tax=Chondrus crispus TaxID=2769 RepID=R7QMJ6_CHOCR|nr:unnamed protein product [Chondrus crispus]CDF39737.1 unnamed protein product [Chondrus crispus]|eukprot:XP_005710031.1 unnamed protein product [Chondrus crispus]
MRPPLSALCQATAVSIATILGTGILGLPVSLHSSGIRPFFLTFTLALFAQLAVVIATVEVLQRAHKDPQPATSDYHPLPNEDPSSAQPLPSHAPPHETAPSLHSIAHHFLPNKPLRITFNAIVVVHFVFILAAYALAGPQAFAALIPALKRAPRWALPTVFLLVNVLAVICLDRALLPSLTIATLFKAALLSSIVFVVFGRGLAIHEDVTNDWRPAALIDPFLMGTFALNGVVNIMPVTFQACLESTRAPDGTIPPLDPPFLRAYRMSTVAAIVICFILNVSWCVGILLCVPQTSHTIRSVAAASGNHDMTVLSNSIQLTLNAVNATHSDASLTQANELGQISTIPLIEVLQARGDQLDWLMALLVNIFIALSITVSFLVMSLGLKHFLDGQARDRTTSTTSMAYDSYRILQYAQHYLFVLVIAVFNPTGLFKIMEGITGLSLNVEAGLFILYMLHIGRRMNKQIPAPLSHTHVLVVLWYAGAYFGSAVLVDILFYLPHAFL